MVRAFVLAAVAGGLLLVPGGAGLAAGQDAAKVVQADDGEARLAAARILSVLHSQRVSYEKDLQTTPLPEVLGDLAKKYDLIFVIDKAAFEEPAALNDTKAEQLLVTRLNGLTLDKFLTIFFRGLTVPDVTYLVRDDRIEITTRRAAQKEAGLFDAVAEAKATGDPTEVVRAESRLNLPLVCVAVENRPLSAVLADLSRQYGLNVVTEHGSRDLLKTPLTERLLNVPADTALELLAGQAGLSVVRKGNTFRIGGGGAM